MAQDLLFRSKTPWCVVVSVVLRVAVFAYLAVFVPADMVITYFRKDVHVGPYPGALWLGALLVFGCWVVAARWMWTTSRSVFGLACGKVVVGRDSLTLSGPGLKTWEMHWEDITSVEAVTHLGTRQQKPALRVMAGERVMEIPEWFENSSGILTEIVARARLGKQVATQAGIQYSRG
jgi:hypothetical protein